MKSSFLHLALAIIVCILSFVGYGVWYATVDAKSVAVANLETRVKAKTATANRVAVSRASLAEIAGDEATIRNYFVPETDIVGFIDSLQVRGKERGASVDVLSVSAAESTATPSLTLSLSINGSFTAVMNTVGAIEYAPYDLTVSSLSVTRQKEGWHASLGLTVGSVSASQSTPATL